MKTWAMAQLGELCTISAGGTPARSNPQYFGGNIPWVKIGDMLQGRITRTDESITDLALAHSSAKILPAGTVLISIFATIGRTAVLGVDASTNQAIAGITPHDSDVLSPAYLRRYLDSVVTTLERKARGVAQVNINSSILKSLPIPLPSLTEQQKILEVLDRADALRAKRREAISLLDNLAQSIFLDMFGNVSVNDRHWHDSSTLGDVASVTSGITKGRKASGAPARTVPYLAVLNVQDKRLNLSLVKEIEVTNAELERYLLIKNDLLLTEGGDPDKLGRGTLWNDELPECIHQNHIFRVRLTPNTNVDPVFLNWLVASERGRRYFLRSAKQTTGIASINASQLRQFPLLIPPIQLQRRFSALLARLKQHESLHLAHLKELNALFASLQYRAFREELWNNLDI